jgi:DNA-binding protein Fis
MAADVEMALAALRREREVYPTRVREIVGALIAAGEVTQRDAAAMLGVSRPTLRKWLTQ